MTLRDETAARINDILSAISVVVTIDELVSLSFRAESERFVSNQLQRQKRGRTKFLITFLARWPNDECDDLFIGTQTSFAEKQS